MNRNCPSALRRVALVAALAFSLASASAQDLTWNGSTNSMATASAWNENGSPAATLNAGANYSISNNASSLLVGSGFPSARSMTFTDANGLRIVSTTSSSFSTSREIVFGASTAGNAIFTLNNSNVSFNATSTTSTTGTPTLTLNLNYSGTATINTDASSSLNISSTLTNTTLRILGTGGLIKDGAGTLRLVGNHTYSGGFTLESGTVIVSTSGTNTTSAVTASPWGTGTLTLQGGTLDSSSNNGRTVRNQTILNGEVTITTAGASSGNYTFSNGAGQGTTLAGDSTLNITQTVNWTQAISGTANLTKTGTGTLRLDAVNTYSGTTNVSAGTLVLDAGASLAGGLNVSSGALFTGTGTVNGAATIAGTHTPGNSPGIQAFGNNLTYTAGASIGWELTDNSATQNLTTPIFDQVSVAGTLDFAGLTSLALAFNGAGSTVDWSNAFWDTTQSWTIYDAAALLNDSNLALAGTDWADAQGDLLSSVRAGAGFSLSVVNGQDLQLSYIPEPSTYAALLGLAGLAAVALRRRKV